MNYRRKISKNYIKNQYVEVYKNQTGISALTQEENEFFTGTVINSVSAPKFS